MQLIRHILLIRMSVHEYGYPCTAIENHTHGGHSVWPRRIYIALWEGLFAWEHFCALTVSVYTERYKHIFHIRALRDDFINDHLHDLTCF